MKFHIYQDLGNQWRWYLSTETGGKVAASTRGYSGRHECVQAIKRMSVAVPAAQICDDYTPFVNLRGAALNPA